MMRDPDIQRVFETADDSLQGVLGYHLYVNAMHLTADAAKIMENLPADHIPITFSWGRFYHKQDLIDAFKLPIFEMFQSRVSLIAIVNVFDAALVGFISCLNTKGYRQYLGKQYLGKPFLKQCIEWAYEQSLQCDVGDREAIRRLPGTFGIIDNARRLRNLIVHNHGLFDGNYEKDAIRSNRIQIEFHPHYSIFKKDPRRPTPIIIATGDVIRFTKAHIEALHILHNLIEKKYFRIQKAYDYREENKPIEWNRVLWGQAKVEIQFTEIRT